MNVDVKMNVLAVLISSKDGVLAFDFLSDYLSLTGGILKYLWYGFAALAVYQQKFRVHRLKDQLIHLKLLNHRSYLL